MYKLVFDLLKMIDYWTLRNIQVYRPRYLFAKICKIKTEQILFSVHKIHLQCEEYINNAVLFTSHLILEI